MDLETSILAGGDLQATKETAIECEVEDITVSEGTTVISVVENGTPVNKGDELCRLDSSELDELARKQEIRLGEARSASVQARLRLETAEIALREYRDGLVEQRTKEFEGKVALGRADTQKMRDHLAWTEGMFAKGYASQAQLVAERQTLAQAEHELRKTEGEFNLFRKFQIHKEMVGLEGEIAMARHNDLLESARVRSEEEELAYIRKQVDRCVIRAPQKGIAVYSLKGFWRRTPLQPGLRVYEKQELFTLPDLSSMEVEASVNETMGPRVKVGMKAAVEVASLGGRKLPGTVSSVTLLSSTNDKEWDERIRHFIVHVRLDKTPPRLLPLMSAVVQIDTGTMTGALVIPVSAMTVLSHQQYCFVIGPRGPERRAVVTRHATREWLEVTAGLKEGERVVLRPDLAAGA